MRTLVPQQIERVGAMKVKGEGIDDASTDLGESPAVSTSYSTPSPDSAPSPFSQVEVRLDRHKVRFLLITFLPAIVDGRLYGRLTSIMVNSLLRKFDFLRKR